tara:strand:+ start:11339 stop:12940 length:1602 start_codon:yes stop_codon:yes gene_type:complete
MIKKLLFIGLLASTTALFSQNQVPEINNFSYTLGTGNITFTYDLFDAENDTCEVFLRASANGVDYDVKPLLATGDIGAGIVPGSGKEIVWTHTIEFLLGNREDYSFQLVADDGYEFNIQAVVDQIDTNEILSNFLKVYGNNHPASPDHYQATRENIFTHYLINGYTAETDSFVFIGDEVVLPREGLNIYGTKTGLVNADSTVIMSGHYDTVEETKGADDNAMSVAVTMEAARILKNLQFKNSIRFAHWDLEEEGLVGANYYANSAKVIGTKSVINFDGMTIYKTEPNSQKIPTGFNILFPAAYAKAEADSFRGNFITVIGDFFSSKLNQQAVQAFETYTPGFRYIDVTCPDPACVIATDLRRSDHAPFWDKGIPSVFMTSSTEFRTDCYHQPCDTTYNLWYSGEVIKAATALLVEQAGIMHAAIAVASNVTGVEQNNNDESMVRFFPNPVVESAYIALNAKTGGELVLTLLQNDGKVVKQMKRQVSAGKQNVVWQPKDVGSGQYIVHVSLNGKIILRETIVLAIDNTKYQHRH